jgi:hypothetical protein
MAAVKFIAMGSEFALSGYGNAFEASRRRPEDESGRRPDVLRDRSIASLLTGGA